MGVQLSKNLAVSLTRACTEANDENRVNDILFNNTEVRLLLPLRFEPFLLLQFVKRLKDA